MIAAAIAFAIIAASLLFASGWVIASGKAREARKALEAQASQSSTRATTLEAELESAKQVRTMLSPVLEREKLARELSGLATDHSLDDLPALLDAIADAGSFSTVMLSDEAGLPVAASAHAAGTPESIDRLGGAASLMLLVIDRADRHGEPRPLGFVVHDESNRMVCHRIFAVDGTRFLLTVVTRSRPLVPSSLDPIIGRLEALLAQRPHERIRAAAVGT